MALDTESSFSCLTGKGNICVLWLQLKSRMCLPRCYSLLGQGETGEESMEREKRRRQKATRKTGQECTDAEKREGRKSPRPSWFQQTISVRTETSFSVYRQHNTRDFPRAHTYGSRPDSPRDGGQEGVLKGGGPKLPLTSDLSRCVFTDSTFR